MVFRIRSISIYRVWWLNDGCSGIVRIDALISTILKPFQSKNTIVCFEAGRNTWLLLLNNVFNGNNSTCFVGFGCFVLVFFLVWAFRQYLVIDTVLQRNFEKDYLTLWYLLSLNKVYYLPYFMILTVSEQSILFTLPYLANCLWTKCTIYLTLSC